MGCSQINPIVPQLKEEKMNNQVEKNKIFYRGTIFTISYFWDRRERDTFVLAECQDDDFIFQIICISGYNSGTIMGHIKRGIFRTARGITYKELVEGIKENILNPDLNSLKVENEYKIKFE